MTSSWSTFRQCGPTLIPLSCRVTLTLVVLYSLQKACFRYQLQLLYALLNNCLSAPMRCNTSYNGGWLLTKEDWRTVKTRHWRSMSSTRRVYYDQLPLNHVLFSLYTLSLSLSAVLTASWHHVSLCQHPHHGIIVCDTKNVTRSHLNILKNHL